MPPLFFSPITGHKIKMEIRYINIVLLPPVKIKKPANLTRLVTVSRSALHYVNTEGVVPAFAKKLRRG
jgi:hypothetical protein